MADGILEKLLQQKKIIEARIRNEQNKEAAKKRKDETRKKIVLGGAYLALEKQEQEITKVAILDYINATARESDKKLFESIP